MHLTDLLSGDGSRRSLDGIGNDAIPSGPGVTAAKGQSVLVICVARRRVGRSDVLCCRVHLGRNAGEMWVEPLEPSSNFPVDVYCKF